MLIAKIFNNFFESTQMIFIVALNGKYIFKTKAIFINRKY